MPTHFPTVHGRAGPGVCPRSTRAKCLAVGLGRRGMASLKAPHTLYADRFAAGDRRAASAAAFSRPFRHSGRALDEDASNIAWRQPEH
jgi:hypothetical protein